MKLKIVLSFLFLCSLSCGLDAYAASKRYTVGSVLISNPWVRASSTANTAVYMDIQLQGTDKNDKLTAVAVEKTVAERIEFHTHAVDPVTGVAAMRKIDGGFEIKAGETFHLKPGSDHIMLMGLKKPLTDKDVVKLELTFENAGKTQIQIPVQVRETCSKKECDTAKDKKSCCEGDKKKATE